MSSGPLLLDTNILLELVRDKDLGKHISSQFNLKSAVHRPLISIVTVGEIWALADWFGFGEGKRAFLKKVLATLVILDINHESVLDAYVELTEPAERRGAALESSRRMIYGSQRRRSPPLRSWSPRTKTFSASTQNLVRST